MNDLQANEQWPGRRAPAYIARLRLIYDRYSNLVYCSGRKEYTNHLRRASYLLAYGVPHIRQVEDEPIWRADRRFEDTTPRHYGQLKGIAGAGWHPVTRWGQVLIVHGYGGHVTFVRRDRMELHRRLHADDTPVPGAPVLQAPVKQSFVIHPGGRRRNVQNLGYILRNWKEISGLHVRRPVDSERNGSWPDAILSVYFRDGREYHTPFMSTGVLAGWIDRPVLRDLPISWFGYRLAVGQKRPEQMEHLAKS